MESKVTKELIFKLFSKQASAMQKQMIDEWALSVDNEELFYKWLDEYELQNPEYHANTEGAISNFHHFINSKVEEPIIIIERKSENLSRGKNGKLWLVAASLIFAICSFAYLSKSLLQYKTYQTAYGETKSFPLPDGSLVNLQANSTLRIPRWGFGESPRIVFLDGEASFSVIHTISHQKFIVQTSKNFEVEVLGTEFSVFARTRGAKVILNKGKVQINLQSGNTIKKFIMKPGELLTLDNQNHIKKKTVSRIEAFQASTGHHYVFEQTTFQEVIYLLAENYGIVAEVEDQELLNETLTGSYTAKDANELLDLIQEVLDINISRQNEKIIFKKNI